MVPSRTRVSQKATPLIEGNPVRNELLLGLPRAGMRLHIRRSYVRSTADTRCSSGDRGTYQIRIFRRQWDGFDPERDAGWKKCGGRSHWQGRMHWATARGGVQDQRHSGSRANCGYGLPG